MARHAKPVPPPRDGSVNVAEAIDFNLQWNKDQPYYVFHDSTQLVELSHLEFGRACHRAAHIIRPGRGGDDGRVVAVIALVDTIVYQAVAIGLVKAGFVPFPISPRNAPPAIIKLLQDASCSTIVGTRTTLKGLFDELARISSMDLNILESPTLDALFPMLGTESETDPFEPYPPPPSRPNLDAVAMYLHSSGSTGFPKCIPQTHRILIQWTTMSLPQLIAHHERVRMGTMALPSFHTIGMYLQTFLPLYGIVSAAVYPPIVRSPDAHPMLPTPDNILEHLKKTECNCLASVPAWLHLWMQNQLDETVELLKSFIFVIYGGGPLSQKVGDQIVAAGVNLHGSYGGTEFGSPTLIRLQRWREQDWEWIRLADTTTVNWADQGDGTYECQFLTTDRHHPAIENMTNPRGYATSDLFIKHPTEPNLWKVVGRMDDVIMHSTGEKTVPGPMEGIVINNPLIHAAVMFGRSHDQAGILIEPAPGRNVDPANLEEVSQFRNEIWPTIEEANEVAPAFSKIYKEMVLITKREKPLPRSPKGSVMRKAALQLYEVEIEDLYTSVEVTSGRNVVEPPRTWDFDGILYWLTTQANDILSRQDISSSRDLFDQGFDSLSSTFLRLRIVGAFHSSPTLRDHTRKIGQNTIYTHPILQDLARFIVLVIDGDESGTTANRGKEALVAMIQKHTDGLDAPIPINTTHDQSAFQREGSVVLITGTTGSVGSQVLADLLRDDSVSRVYALNRPGKGSEPILRRHESKFEDMGLEVGLLRTDKLKLLQCDVSEDRLGLSSELHQEVQAAVNLIIHVAWRVDFNLGLTSFESNIKGTRNLVDLARSSHHGANTRFIFISSVAIAQGWDKAKGSYPEEIVSDESFALGTGYGESKYVAEKMLERSGLQATSIRLGQVSGGLPNGAWACTEWLPILVKSSVELGALPQAHGSVSWLTMDAASRAILDIALTPERPPLALNAVHPRPVLWQDIMQAIAKEIPPRDGVDGIPFVPFSQWVERLEERAKYGDEADLQLVPGIKLLDFYRNMARADAEILRNGRDEAEVGGMCQFETKKAQDVSVTMRLVKPVGALDARSWVRYWQSVGFLQTPPDNDQVVTSAPPKNHRTTLRSLIVYLVRLIFPFLFK
ncbi:unnamed protein product [Cyclocybe aegerita]|uniref:Uncharacterized protein n=1 Tax=Cyclocybe aegerita TaxID=1973307 RepID=A0A8S0W594_CYCAE|nr:unnamed protein product [Cyclocybe aegerita]